MALNKKTALITGASRGIGKALAQKLAKEGYHLGLFCHSNINDLNNYSRVLQEKHHVEIYTYQGDVGDFYFIRDAINDALKKLGHFDVLINNAGIAHIGLLTDMSIDQWNSIINTNLTSVFNTSSQVVPNMVANRYGRIINISSMWGSVGASCEVAYSASKGGINSFTKALAKELAPSGDISVNAIACGVVDTDMNSMLSAQERLQLESQIPADRFCQPGEIARVAFNIITSPSYMTGQIIGVDGGYI